MARGAGKRLREVVDAAVAAAAAAAAPGAEKKKRGLGARKEREK